MEMMRLRVAVERMWVMILLGLVVIVPPVAGESMSGLTFVSAEGTSGSIARVPLSLYGITEPVGELTLTFAYNPAFLSAIDVIKGGTGVNTTLAVAMDRGIIDLTIADPEGISEGTVAFVRFTVLATSGSSPLRITHLAAKSAATRAPFFLPRHEGTFTIIPGVSFSTTAAGQRIAVDPTLAGTAVTVRGNTISFERDNLWFTCVTGGLAEGAGRKTGIVQQVSVISPPFVENLSYGQVTEQFTFTTPTYSSEGQLRADLEEVVTPPLRESIIRAGERSRLNISRVLFTTRITMEGFPATGPVNGTFTLPASLLPPSSNEGLRIGHLKDDGTMEFTQPLVDQGAGHDTLILSTPLKQGYPTLGVVIASEVARPPVTAIPRTTSGTIFSEGGEVAGGSIWAGMFLIFFLVVVVVIGVFYVHRRRGG